MGLGKTVRSIFSRKYSDVNSINVFKHQPQVQAATFISAMIKAKHVKRALVVVPVAVMPQWLESLREWGRGKLVLWLFHGSSVKRRNRALRMASTHGGVCVTTYSMIRLHVDKFIKDTTWDVLICDEAHIIKNAHSKTSKAMRKIESRHRYLLTGTPIQNSLSEYRHLLVYAAGSSLDLYHNDNDDENSEEFRHLVQNPIERGAARDATDVQKRRAISLTRSLHEAARPFVLRRTYPLFF